MRRQSPLVAALGLLFACDALAQNQSNWPMFGGSPARNMANLVDKNIPIDWSIEKDNFKNVKWAVPLGSRSFGGPVVAGGRIYVGTNNANPRDAKDKDKNKSVLMCLDETDGRLLWQNLHAVPPKLSFSYFDRLGLLSTPTIDAGRVYYVTTAAEVNCADAATGKILWKFDMMAKLGVYPGHLGCVFSSSCSPLVAGDKLFVMTGNGMNEETGKIEAPEAPSFVAFDKVKGTLAWQRNPPGSNVIEVQWSNPVLATVAGRPQVIFAGGDSVLYSFEPDSGKLIWKFNLNLEPPAMKNGHGDGRTPNYPAATPVVHGDRLYVGLGTWPNHPTPATRHSYFLCIDITKKGDVSSINLNPHDPRNKNSALVWAFGGPNGNKGPGRRSFFGHTVSTAAVHDGLVWIAEERGYVHCLDAKTGQRYWEYDLKETALAAPYWVDGKIFVATDASVFVFAHGKNPKLLATLESDDIDGSTPLIAANGVLYLRTRSALYAITRGGMARELK